MDFSITWAIPLIRKNRGNAVIILLLLTPRYLIWTLLSIGLDKSIIEKRGNSHLLNLLQNQFTPKYKNKSFLFEFGQFHYL